MSRTLTAVAASVAISASTFSPPASGQLPSDPPAQNRARILEVAREVMSAARYCALITLDGSGQAHARTMDAFPPEEGFVVWMGTNPGTRKVVHIRADPRVTLHYFDPASAAYVTLAGTAEIVDDPDEKAVRFKEDWASFYEDREHGYTLIRVEPVWLEVVSEGHGVTGDATTWRPPRVMFPRNLDVG